MNNSAGEVRRSSAVLTFGPGAIMDMRADGAPVSGVATGLEEWDSNAPLDRPELKNQRVTERRLQQKLDVKYFRLAPVIDQPTDAGAFRSQDPPSLVMRRFPEWLQCPACNLIQPAGNWSANPGEAGRFCATCSKNKPGSARTFVAPVRFVAACERGHLEDFPWHFWLRHSATCSKKDRLYLSSKGPGLSGLILTCPDSKCKQSRSLDGALNKNALVGRKCSGGRPWLARNEADCQCTGKDGNFRALQRGASNLYYSVVESALDIPPWSDSLSNVLGDYWDDLEECETDQDRLAMVQSTPSVKKHLVRFNIDAEGFVRQFSQLNARLDSWDADNLRREEFAVLASPQNYGREEGEFASIPTISTGALERHFSITSRITRLREVRVLTGFTRIVPPGSDSDTVIAPLSDKHLSWLPAVELRGEGIFLQFNEASLSTWEQRDDVVARIAEVRESWKIEGQRRKLGSEADALTSPRHIMIHTFAHIFINQLALECGYSAASIRERLYVEAGPQAMAGLLVYTGTPDSDGTLGGLQSRGAVDLVSQTVEASLKNASWCSADPLCISGHIASPESFSLASRHSCSMVPETSCELHNRFLDRALLVGTPESQSLGFFLQ